MTGQKSVKGASRMGTETLETTPSLMVMVIMRNRMPRRLEETMMFLLFIAVTAVEKY